MRLGADPEVFLLDCQTTLPISVIGKIGGNKQFPLQIEGKKVGFTLQEDNVALEFGIPPAKTCSTFIKNIREVMAAGEEKLGNGVVFSNLSCLKFPEKELEHPLANRFGCEPDYNAWTGKVNEKLDEVTNIRTAGGHVHLETELDPNLMGRALDLYLGIPSLIMDKKGEPRRAKYGKAGAIRYKPYGLEYRVLSNFWIFQSKYIKWVWGQCHLAAEAVEKGIETPNAVELIINNNDILLAKYMIKEYNLNVC